MCPPVTPLFHSSGDTKSGKEERHGSFWEIILWNDVRRLVLKMTESERIDAPTVPMKIVAFLAAVPTMFLWGMIGASAQHLPE